MMLSLLLIDLVLLFIFLPSNTFGTQFLKQETLTFQSYNLWDFMYIRRLPISNSLSVLPPPTHTQKKNAERNGKHITGYKEIGLKHSNALDLRKGLHGTEHQTFSKQVSQNLILNIYRTLSGLQISNLKSFHDKGQ